MWVITETHELSGGLDLVASRKYNDCPYIYGTHVWMSQVEGQPEAVELLQTQISCCAGLHLSSLVSESIYLASVIQRGCSFCEECIRILVQ